MGSGRTMRKMSGTNTFQGICALIQRIASSFNSQIWRRVLDTSRPSKALTSMRTHCSNEDETAKRRILHGGCSIRFRYHDGRVNRDLQEFITTRMSCFLRVRERRKISVSKKPPNTVLFISNPFNAVIYLIVTDCWRPSSVAADHLGEFLSHIFWVRLRAARMTFVQSNFQHFWSTWM